MVILTEASVTVGTTEGCLAGADHLLLGSQRTVLFVVVAGTFLARVVKVLVVTGTAGL